MKKNAFILIILLFIGIYGYMEMRRPPSLEWSRTYSITDKNPFGAYIVYRSLPFLFSGKQIENGRKPILEQFEEIGSDKYAYFIIDHRLRYDNIEITYLIDFVEKGNYLFIAAETMPDTLLSFFDLEYEHIFRKRGSNFFTQEGINQKEYKFDMSYGNYFELKEHFNGRVLGYIDTISKPNFIEFTYGEGKVFLSLLPVAFTNYYILDSLDGDYYYKALSYIPSDVNVIWDQYYILGPRGEGNVLSVIWRYPALKWAWYLLLLTAFFYLLTKMKREQKMIPVITPPENKKIDFVRSVSALYYKRSNHYEIGIKHVEYFLYQIQKLYKIPTEKLDEDFIQQLKKYSGVEEKDIRKLVKMIKDMKEFNTLGYQDLGELEQLTRKFF